MKHAKEVHEKEIKVCENCNKTFKNAKSLQLHNANKHFTCEICNETFKNTDSLLNHGNEIHGAKIKYIRIKYKNCDKNFKSYTGMFLHNKTVHEGIRHKCDFCDRVFTQNETLYSHIENIHKKKIDRNSKNSKNKSTLNNVESDPTIMTEINLSNQESSMENIDKTSKEKNDETECNLKSETLDKSNSTLNNDNDIHGKEIEFVCESCNKIFKTAKSLRMHKTWKHNTCEICNETFKNTDSLLKHGNEIHGTKVKYRCESCDKNFKTDKGLFLHERVHKGIRYKCDFCDKVFTQINPLNSHIENYHKRKTERNSKISNNKSTLANIDSDPIKMTEINLSNPESSMEDIDKISGEEKDKIPCNLKRKNNDSFQEIATKSSKSDISADEEISQSIFINEEEINENMLTENTEIDPLGTSEEFATNSNIVLINWDLIR